MKFRGIVAIGMFAVGASACIASDPDGEFEDEETAESMEALITSVTPGPSVINANCNPSTSTVSLNLDAQWNKDTAAPWKQLSITGSFGLGSGANRVRLEYWVDGNKLQPEESLSTVGISGGTWKFSYPVTCTDHSVTVCATPGIISSYSTSYCENDGMTNYQKCITLPFRGCANAIGVIPDINTNCPAGSDTLYRVMDAEDAHSCIASGWTGKTVTGSDIAQTFCRVDGTRFKPLTSCATDTKYNYAVLSLGTQCPNGSVKFGRYLDNEDDNNGNQISMTSGDIYPIDYGPQGKDTEYYFCLFQSATNVSATMGTFPDLSIPYGVFAPSALYSAGKANAYGWAYVDDEDTNCWDRYDFPSNPPPSTMTSAKQIIVDTNNNRDTTFNMARVNTSTNQARGPFARRIAGMISVKAMNRIRRAVSIARRHRLRSPVVRGLVSPRERRSRWPTDRHGPSSSSMWVTRFSLMISRRANPKRSK